MYLYVTFIVLSLIVKVKSIYHVQIPEKEECSCSCSDIGVSKINVCQKLSRFEKELSTVKDAIEYRTRYINEINELREKLEWQDFLVDTLSKQIESFKILIPENPRVLKPEPLTMKPEYEIQNDSSGSETRTTENDVNLIKNVSNLLAKVEVVENMTMEVQEELKSERRVRRHIEDDLNEARTSLKVLGDKFLNLTLPAESKVSNVEEIVISTIESLNKTLFEDHLQKLYYKVDNVVYKNETKKLDERLENVESELHIETNSSILNNFKDHLRNLSNSVQTIDNSLSEMMAAQDERLKSLEEKVEHLDGLVSLNNQIEILLNASDLMQHGVSELWIEIQEMRNYTTFNQNELESRITQVEMYTTPTEMLKLSLEIENLKHNISETQDYIKNAENNMKILSADIAIAEDKVYKLSIQHESGLKEIDEKLENMTQMLFSALDTEKYEKISNKSKKFEELVTSQQPAEITDLEENNNTSANYDLLEDYNDIDNVVTSINEEYLPCSLPTSHDDHLLIVMVNNSNGEQELLMSCKPIGQYALSEYKAPIICKNGKWDDSLPVCRKLLTEEEINEIALELRNADPCLTMSSGEDHPDPVNCNRYFRCVNGKSVIHRCPSGQTFDEFSNSCQIPELSDCKHHNTPQTELLENLLPTLLIDPSTIDQSYSLMGTDPSGQLVVYPGKNLKVHCIYPDNIWGFPSLTFSNSSRWILSEKTAPNRITMNIINPTSNDSGTYSCITPFRKKLSISIIVKDVSCPAIEGEFSHNIYYRPHPEGMTRVLSTVALFGCDGSKTVSAMCLPTGQWSRFPPTLEECPQLNIKPWRCPNLNDVVSDPFLILEPKEKDLIVLFKCAGNYRLIGNPFTRCREDGTWSHSSLPRCIRR